MTKLEDIYKSFNVIYFKDEEESKLVNTGLRTLDNIMGGIPIGRLMEIFGAESNGKTALALQFAKQLQDEGYKIFYLDTEGALDKNFVSIFKLDTENLLVARPDCIEDVFDIIEKVLKNKTKKEKFVFVWDSVASTSAKEEFNNEFSKETIGLQARQISKGLRKIIRLVRETDTCLIFINQVREKIGVMFGDKYTTTGGKAIKYYSTIRLKVERVGKIKDKDEVKGIKVRITTEKNKIIPPYKRTELDFYFDKGFDELNSFLSLLVSKGVIKKEKRGFSYKGVKFYEKDFKKIYDKSKDEFNKFISENSEQVIEK